MHFSHARALARIDHDRRSLAGTIRGRLIRANRAGDELGDALERLAFVAYLRGMRRQVLECSQAIGRDARVAHLSLSRREDDEERERDWLLWLLAFLGLPWTTVELKRHQATQAAQNAARQMRRAATRRLERQELEPHAPGQAARPTVLEPTTPGDQPGVQLAPRHQIDTSPRYQIDTSPGIDVFGEWGKADVHLEIPLSLIDTWSETLAYTQYERGRHEARDVFPAVADALWGHRWSSILDDRTTMGCRLLDGWVAPIGDTWMRALAPPRHFNCRAVLIPVWQSSTLRKPPTPVGPKVNETTLQRYLAQKEQFLRLVA